MKNIELTENHKSKLLEMCKKLFPDYYWSFDKCKSKEYEIKIDNILTGTVQGKSEMDQTSEIVTHWFEFCIIHLSSKVDCDISHNVIYLGNHPVDYLYEEFKKLK